MPTRSNGSSGSSRPTSGISRYTTSTSGGVRPATVSRPRLGSEAITWPRFTNCGSVTPRAANSGVRTRTPLKAIRRILMPSPRSFQSLGGLRTPSDEIQQLPQRAELRQSLIGKADVEAFFHGCQQAQRCQAIEAQLAHKVVIQAGAVEAFAGHLSQHGAQLLFTLVHGGVPRFCHCSARKCRRTFFSAVRGRGSARRTILVTRKRGGAAARRFSNARLNSCSSASADAGTTKSVGRSLPCGPGRAATHHSANSGLA